MDLIETTAIAAEDLPVATFRAHLRLGVGFADSASLDPELARHLSAAIARIEAESGKILLQRGFKLILRNWRTIDAQTLPVAPVTAIQAITLRNRANSPTIVASDRYRLFPDRHRPQIVARGAMMPAIPIGGLVEIDFTAGFGPSWDAVPDDLAHAVMILAARFFEDRTGAGTPATVSAMIARWTPTRLTAGGHRG
ncbi:hypothetical protein [Pararhodobacter sp. SW119]|uniref:head-tail connector protein n=1 Tax=Pararhodobacter sp. SW119 TaxID=2780075 RepID=UPI001ADF258D|nr:hypothetical protein [Pararhodobacter sp. SW119]